MSAIDHKAKMLEALEAADQTTFPDLRRNSLLEAQVQAAAYAAEQQRIGNLIEHRRYLVEIARHEKRDERPWTIWLDRQISDALGLA